MTICSTGNDTAPSHGGVSGCLGKDISRKAWPPRGCSRYSQTHTLAGFCTWGILESSLWKSGVACSSSACHPFLREEGIPYALFTQLPAQGRGPRRPQSALLMRRCLLEHQGSVSTPPCVICIFLTFYTSASSSKKGRGRCREMMFSYYKDSVSKPCNEGMDFVLFIIVS